MQDDAESGAADTASSGTRIRVRPATALQAGCGLALLVAAALPDGTEPLTRAALAVSAAGLVASSAASSAGSARTGDPPRSTSSSRAGPVLLGSAAVVVGVVQVVAPSAGPRVPALTEGGLLLAVALVAAALWVQVRLARPWWNPDSTWDAAITGLGAAAVGVSGLSLSVRAAGPDVATPAVGMVAVTTLLGAAALAAAALAGDTPRVDGRRIGIAAVVLVVADQVSLAARGLPVLAPGPGLAGAGTSAGTGSAAGALAAAVAVTGLALAAARPASPERRLRPGRSRTPVGPATLTVACAVLLAGVLLGAGPGGSTEPGIRAGGLLGLACLLAAVAGAARRHRVRLGPTGDVRPRTDDLTGLANRRALAEALAGERSPGGGDETVGGWSGWAGWSDEIALLLVDLDNFKDVNDALGHEAGDRLLAAVGTRLRAALRPTQLLARLGGDEFAVVLPAAGVEQAARVAEGLRDSLGPAFEIDGTRLHVQASVGAATCDPARGDPRDLLRQADVAMYQAKADGLGVAFYDPDTDDARAGDRLRRTGELRDALQRGDLEVYLQPQIDLRTGAIVGAEALARWRHPQDGVLLPDSFLPLAERTGLMRPVTAQLVDRALEACATWWAAGHKVTVSVNLGAGDLREADVGRQISAALDRYGLPPAALRVEITEQSLLRDPVAVAATLRAWRTEGVTVAVDDFGTGYSSLSYLRILPVDEVKLDRAFIGDAARPRSATIVRHTAAMAHDLGAVVVAEGIEDDETARLVARLGCDVGQGLHFGAAMTVDQFLARLG